MYDSDETENVKWNILFPPDALSSVQFSCLVMFHSSWPHGLQHVAVHHQHPELTQTHVHQVADAIQPSHPLSSPFLPTFKLSQHQVLSNESILRIRWPKYWSFSFNILPMNIQDLFPLGLISLQVWFPCSPRDSQESSLTPQFKASIFWHSPFSMVQFSHPYMTTRKTIVFTIWTFVSKVMSLLFNMLIPWKKIYDKSRQLIKNQRHYSIQKFNDGSNTIPYSLPLLCV